VKLGYLSPAVIIYNCVLLYNSLAIFKSLQHRSYDDCRRK